MKLHPLDLSAILTTIVGVSALAADSTFQTELTSLLGPQAHKIVAFIGIIGLVSSQLLRTYGAPSTTTPPPESSK
jgi:hypothetical protein